MHLIKKLLLLMVVANLLFSFTHSYANGNIHSTHRVLHKKTVLHTKKIKKSHWRNATTIKLAPFNSIVTEGNFHLRIMQGPQRVAIVKSAAADQISITVKGGTLYLTRCCVEPTDKNLKKTDIVCINEPVFATIWVPNLENLTLSGTNSVTATHIRGYGLSIRANDDSDVILRGEVSLSKVITTGNSSVDIRWVDSHGVTIIAQDESHIALAGVTRSLRARVFGSAAIDTRYLRAKEVLVQTQDTASAQVLAIDSLSAFADDDSNIYYYKIANHHLEYTCLSGNVLQMGNWN